MKNKREFGEEIIAQKTGGSSNVGGRFPLSVRVRGRVWLCLALMLGLVSGDADAQTFTERNPDQDFNTLGVAGGNKGPQGIFGINGIMLVSDVNGRIYSYDLASKERQDSHHNDGITNADDFILYKDPLAEGETRNATNSTRIIPYGIWANGSTNGSTLWAVHSPPKNQTGDRKIYAYTITNNVSDVRDDLSGDERYWTGVRDSSKDIGSLKREDSEGNETDLNPTELWSDGTTMRVADNHGGESSLYAYKMKDKTRDRDKDIELSVNTGQQDPYDYTLDKNSSPQGIWSDGVTMWVAEVAGATDSAEKRIYAYNMWTNSPAGVRMFDGSRVPFNSKDYKNLNRRGNVDDNDRPRGICSDGETMWVADITDNKLYAYYAFRDTNDRNPNEDLDGLSHAGNHDSRGLWSDGETMWVADPIDDQLYAYDLTTGEREVTSDFSLRTLSTNRNTTPTGLWSDGTTIWVADNFPHEQYPQLLSRDKIYAYNLATKARDAGKDINSLKDSGNQHPRGLWSDGTTMWVADSEDNKLYAYKKADGTRDAATIDKDIELDSANADARGLWSDGTTMWVADEVDNKLYAYKVLDGTRDSVKDYNTLEAAGNHAPYGLWSDGTIMWVSDYGDNKVYAYNTWNVEARLGALEVKGYVPSPGEEDFAVDLKPKFNSGTMRYEASVPFATERLTLGAKTLRLIDRDRLYSQITNATTKASKSLEDVDDEKAGFQVDLAVGKNLFEITVMNGNPNTNSLPRTRTYTIDVEREFFTFNDPGKDIALASAHANPRGLWANETIMWVANIGDTNKLYAYNKADGTRFSELIVEVVGQTATTNTVYSKDITLDSANTNPRGIWSNGTTIWVADSEADKLYAYQLANGNPDPSKDIPLAETPMDKPSDRELENNDNSDPEWIWSDGVTMWVSDSEDKKIYAYNMSDKTRNKSREIVLSDLSKANDLPQGLWSDGENLWVANGTAGNVKLYAYKLAGERIDCREETKDFNTLEDAGKPVGDGNLHPKGIFSDGATMYVVDSDDSKIYAYNQPLSDNASLRRVELSDVYYEGKTFNDYFQTERRLDFYQHAYVVYSPNATTTISNIETQDPRVNVEKQGDDLLGWKIQSPADADSAVDGHQVHLTPGDTTEITILVTAQSGASREHIIRIANHPAGPLPFRDFNYLFTDDDENNDINSRSSPAGLWTDGTTMWIAEPKLVPARLRAYNMDETGGKVWGAMDNNKDIGLYS